MARRVCVASTFARGVVARWIGRSADTASQSTAQTVALFALVLPVLIGSMGLGIDYGSSVVAQCSAQAAADSAAIAGAQQLPDAPLSVSSRATAVAATNGFADGVEVTTVDVQNPPTSGPSVGDALEVEVTITRAVTTNFVRIFGIGTVTVTARSVARQAGGPLGLPRSDGHPR